MFASEAPGGWRVSPAGQAVTADGLLSRAATLHPANLDPALGTMPFKLAL
jgi:hypothetical protein